MTSPGPRYPGTGATTLGGPSANPSHRNAFADVPTEQLARASYGPRIRAAVVDGAILSVPFVGAAVALVAGPQRRATCISTTIAGTRTAEACTAPTTTSIIAAAVLVVLGVLAAGWYLVVRQGRRGSTLGKQWQGIAVVDATTRRAVGSGVLARREVTRFVGAIVTLGFFAVYDHLRPLWNERGQRVHDQVAGTIVIAEQGARQ